MLEDLRFAFRQLRKAPGFTAIAVTTLGLGIGAAAAMFGLIQGVLLSPPPYADPDRVILVSPARADGQPYPRGATIGQWLAWRNARAFEAPAVYGWTFNFLVQDEGSESLGGMARLAQLSFACSASSLSSAASSPNRRRHARKCHPRRSSSGTSSGSGSSTATPTSLARRFASAGCRRRCRSSA